jgi:phytoene dehydrogenase-like protein
MTPVSRPPLPCPPGGRFPARAVPAHPPAATALTPYAPNVRRALLDWRLFTPADLKARVGLTDGNIRHLDLVPAQTFARRPLPGWSRYRTPLPGL